MIALQHSEKRYRGVMVAMGEEEIGDRSKASSIDADGVDRQYPGAGWWLTPRSG